MPIEINKLIIAMILYNFKVLIVGVCFNYFFDLCIVECKELFQ